MADGLNKAILIGRLGQAPELKQTKHGALLRCRLATNETYLDREGHRRERTDWHTVLVWGKRAEALERVLDKGGRIGVEGRIQVDVWEDQDGRKRTSTEVVARNILLLDSRRPGFGATLDGDRQIPEEDPSLMDAAEIPF